VQGVYVYQPDSIYSKITTTGIACYGGTASATGNVLSGGTPQYSYSWSNGSTGNPANNLTPGDHWLYVTDSHGCKDSTRFHISEPPPITHDTTITPVACAMACNGTILLPVYGGTQPYTYTWSNNLNSGNLQNLCAGNYAVTVTDHNGCSFTDNYTVGISDYLPSVHATTPTPVIYSGQTAHLYAVANSSYQYTWSPSGTLNGIHLQNPLATPDESTIYTVTVQDSWGCQNTDTVAIIVMDVICREPYIYVPNAFTPNDDGQNDVLYVKADMASDLFFAIYDRWGEQVFSTTQSSKGWDGTYKGKSLDPAVFVYYLKVTCINNMQFEKKGNITLIR
jgi:gliding motility-associated-like protein